MAGTYKNGQGNEHDERRDQWYNNKDLFEQMQDLRKDFNETRLAIQQFNAKFEKYNGLWERIKKLEALPCKQEAEVKELKDLARGILTEWNQFKHTRSAREKVGDDVIKWSGWMIGAIGGILGALSLLGVF